MTRRLPHGRFAAGIALVDRTCLGIKDGFLRLQTSTRDLADFVDEVGQPHGGMIPCEPLVAQSIVYHAIDYARRFGFEPHPDFPALLFGPRPAELLNTPWSAPERPVYIAGPHDNAPAIANELTKTLGVGGFDLVDAYDDVSDDDGDLIHSPLERTIPTGDAILEILIYRQPAHENWTLEIEDQSGGSTVLEEEFESDQAALDAALHAIEAEGAASLVVDTTSG